MAKTTLYMLEKQFASNYVTFILDANITSLIARALAIWTWNSGAAMQALLAYKPVCYFVKDYDHTYGPIAKFCKSVEEAAESYIVDKELVDIYLTWFYKIFTLNVTAPDFKYKLERRIINYFTHNYSLEELFSEHSAFK